MHTAIVVRELRRRAATGMRSRRTVLCCGVDPGPAGLVLVAMVALAALFLGWLTFRVLSPLPVLGERLWGRFRRSRRPVRPADDSGSRDATQSSAVLGVDSAHLSKLQSTFAAGGTGDAQGAVSKRVARANTLIKMVAVVVVLTVLAVGFWPSYCDHPRDLTPRAKVSELILAGSEYRTAISEKFMSELDPANAGADLTLGHKGRISGGSISRDGTIVIHGSTAGTSVGHAVTVTITPTYNTATGTITWNCKGQPTEHMPMTCR
jgi:type IV pilus assembly protein PilA